MRLLNKNLNKMNFNTYSVIQEEELYCPKNLLGSGGHKIEQVKVEELQ